MDLVERAEEQRGALENHAISLIRAKAHSRLPYAGECYYCGEHLEEPKVFCDATCRDSYDREKELKARLGRSNR